MSNPVPANDNRSKTLERASLTFKVKTLIQKTKREKDKEMLRAFLAKGGHLTIIKGGQK